MDDYSELQNSENWINFLVMQSKFERYFNLGKPYNFTDNYLAFYSSYKGPEREWLLYTLVNKAYKYEQNIRWCILYAKNHLQIKNASIKNYFNELLASRLIGSTPYNFSFADINGRTIMLSDLKGKVVLIDTWHHGCGACVRNHPYLDSIKNLFSSNDFIVVSMFIDYINDRKSGWEELIKEGAYTNFNNLNLLLNPKTAAGEKFLKSYQIIGDPTFVLIDRTGKIGRSFLDPVTDKGRSLVEAIKALL